MKAPATRGFLLSPYAPWLVFAIGLVVSCMLWFDARQAHDERVRLDFAFQLAKVVDAIERRMAAHGQILRGVSGLYAASREVDRTEFHNYVTALHLEATYPGIQGIGFAQVVPPGSEAAHVAAIRRQGFPNYRLHPESQRDTRTGIVFLEPFDWRNQRAFGYDMYAEEARNRAMSLARDTGVAALSGKVTLVQETENDIQPGTLLYLPIYASGSDPGTLERRRREVIGWVYSPLRMRNLLDALFLRELEELTGSIGFAVWDHAGSGQDELLYRSAEKPAQSHYQNERLLQVAGRAWRVEAFALAGYVRKQGDSRALLLLLGGMGMTTLLTLFLEMLGRKDRNVTLAHEELARSRSELQNIYDTSRVAIFLLDLNGLIVHANRGMAEMFCLPLEKLVGIRYETLVAGSERHAAHEVLASLLVGGRESADLERLYQRENGEFIGRVAARTMRDSEGRVVGVVGAISDITESRRNEIELRIAAIAFESSEAMVVTDARARVVRVNKAFTELTGYTQEEIIGRNLRMLASGRHSAEFFDNLWQEIREKGAWQGEVWNRHKNGEVYPQWQTITAVRDERGRTTHYVGSAFNISQRVAQDNEMRNLAFYDPLTGLANRRLFNDRLQHAVAKCSRSHALGAVIYLDLDHFKQLNDLLGHAEGDHLLQSVADRLAASVREGDTVARFGGDEFVILLEELSDNRDSALLVARDIAEALRVALNQPYSQQSLMPAGWQCTPSIGIALFCDAIASSATVIERADAALYSAKKGGRNRVCIDDACPAAPESSA